MDSEDHGLTELGRAQSQMLAERLARMSGSTFRDRHNEYRVQIVGIWSSDVARARQTAEIIAEHLPGVRLHEPDPLLAEGQPAVPAPQKSRGGVRPATLWEDSARIELAFRRFVHRDLDHKLPRDRRFEAQPGEPASDAHVFEIIVCHCNVIRYFVMRALQLPPEAWLRLGGFNAGLAEVVVRPNGSVSLVRFGDTGHLPMEMTSFH